ncbi:MAG: nucleotidyltransferase family protein [Wujia sp.]
MDTMPIEEIINQVMSICKENGVEHLSLFGSFATGTNTDRSDVDFVVYGCKDIVQLEEKIDQIQTLRKIDIFNYDDIHNEFLLEDIRIYAKQIY